jgi:hypothetical protein
MPGSTGMVFHDGCRRPAFYAGPDCCQAIGDENRGRLPGKTASLRGKTIDREVKAVIHFASSLKATAPEIAPGAFLCWRDTRQWVMEAGYFQTRPDTHQ